MVGGRCPVPLETAAMNAWLQTLEAGVERDEGKGLSEDVTAPLVAPPGVLAMALREGMEWNAKKRRTRSREVVVARLAVAVVMAGMSRLEVRLYDSALVALLVEALHTHPNHLKTLNLILGMPAKPLPSTFAPALSTLTALTSLTIKDNSYFTDTHLAALAAAQPPLAILDVSWCDGVTDQGIKALVCEHIDVTKEDLLGKRVEGCGCLATTLKAINLEGTRVSTHGCLVALVVCPALCTLKCEHMVEALDLLVREESGGGRDTLALLQLHVVSDEPLPPVHDLARVCPLLESVDMMWRSVPVSVKGLVEGLPALTTLELIYFNLGPEPSILPFHAPHLTHLHLAPREPYPMSLPALGDACPALTHLTLENVILTLPSQPPPPPQSNIEQLTITTFNNDVIERAVGMWAMVWARGATCMKFGRCGGITDQDILHVLEQGALCQVEDLTLESAHQVTAEALKAMVRCCPALRRLELRELLEGQRPMCQSFERHIKEYNIDLDLVVTDF